MNNSIGKINIAVGLSILTGFMIYGFYLIYMRDFSAGKETWVAASNTGDHFEAKLAHVHGNLFSIINIIYGYLLLKLAIPKAYAKWVSILAITGLLMPIGIFAELYLGLPFYLVLVGAISIILATILLAIGVMKIK